MFVPLTHRFYEPCTSTTQIQKLNFAPFRSRASPYRPMSKCALLYASIQRAIYPSSGTAHALRAKKNTAPTALKPQKQCPRAPPGVRTLDTLIKRDLAIPNKANFPQVTCRLRPNQVD